MPPVAPGAAPVAPYSKGSLGCLPRPPPLTGAALWSGRAVQEKKKEEAAAKRLEAKRLAAEEEAAMANFGKKKPAAKPSATKVTSHQLSTMKEREARQAEAEAAERADAASRTVKEADYAAAVEVENVNKPGDEGVEARSIEGAIGALSLGGDADADRNPEK